MNWRRWIPLIIVVAGVMAYHNSFMGQFIFDDGLHIHNNPRIRQAWPPWEALGETARPLVQWSLALNHATGEFNPFDYHLFNLVVHLLAGLTLYGVLRRTLVRVAQDRRPETGDRRLGSGGPRTAEKNEDPETTGTVTLHSSVISHPSSVISPAHAAILAGIIALLWVVHPLNTQAVTYIIQRGESMMGLFYLLTLYCFIRGAEQNDQRLTTDDNRLDTGGPRSVVASSDDRTRQGASLQTSVHSPQSTVHSRRRSRSLWLTASVAACAAGMATKPIMVTAPLLILAYDVLYACGSWSLAIKQRRKYYLCLAASWLVIPLLLLNGKSEWQGSAGFEQTPVAWWQYALTQPGVILHYLKLVVWPVGLCFDYLWPVAQGFWQIAPPLLFVSGLFALTIYLFYRSSALAFPGLWFFGILSVTSSFMPIADLAVEHRMYLPTAAAIGVVVIAADQVRRVGSRDHTGRVVIGQWLGIGATMLVVTVFVVLTIHRNADYHDAIGMWNKVIAQRVLHSRAYGQIGQIHSLGMNKHKEAIPYFEKVIALAPEMSSGYSSLGGVWSNLGDHEKALAYYQKASALETNSAALVTKVGVQHAALGRWDEAMRFYGKALQIDPNNALAHNNMGVALNRQGKTDEALHHFRQAVAHDSLDPAYRVDLGSVLRALHQPEAAIEQYQAALRLAPHHHQTRVDLGIAFLEAGHKREAIDQFQVAVENDPGRIDVLISMTWILATDPDPVIRDGHRAVQLGKAACKQSGYKLAPALDVLAAAFAEVGQFDAAVTTAEQALLIAEQTGNSKVASEIRQRLALYKQGKPFRL